MAKGEQNTHTHTSTHTHTQEPCLTSCVLGVCLPKVNSIRTLELVSFARCNTRVHDCMQTHSWRLRCMTQGVCVCVCGTSARALIETLYMFPFAVCSFQQRHFIDPNLPAAASGHTLTRYYSSSL